ncbi:hypothetical protein [Helicobacter cetorum]|uniref:DUF904 domain-containing protein n=1 Tax=Helicobacter cetorum (strain ATCC BAA-429 / MIT 00-7128) TaxID=182217 RepID=I0EPW2_HELC0|nr:hypothetical protein [Helicobacter cetorum]AFI04981.1 hypothetical protein HCW_08630 [Helicobacter cetorum MIT 00-7128]
MESLSLLDKLNAKIDELIKKTKRQDEELQELRTQITTLNAQNEEKTLQIAILYDDLNAKDNELNNKEKGLQDIYDKLEKMMSHE